ncbi:MAG: hypothetical protein KatS3mg029_0714 [Saprospiraceae bacterium]|nr:MAG: hypothetical protein KatS3mg029_0714 [Saprospiraceae bacterium]
MDSLFSKLKDLFDQTRSTVGQQATNLGQAARQKSEALIDEWISVLPKLQAMGFQIQYFALEASINPTLVIEMQADYQQFPMERIQSMSEQWRESTPMYLIFSTMKTTLSLYQRTNMRLVNPLVVRISLKLVPEIQVSFGKPNYDM